MSNSNFDQPIVVVVDGHKKANALLIHVSPSQTVGELRDLIKIALSLHPKFHHFENLTLYLYKIFLNPPPLYKTILGISSDVVSLDRAYLRWKLQLTENVGDVLDRSVYEASLGPMYVVVRGYKRYILFIVLYTRDFFGEVLGFPSTAIAKR
ncbi:MAG: hypothetical protein J3R72DRAFT_490556 [Linnemannia gamsii]|nr:MAG: hypothetical protein J3R72DRAFT_490556 [Linnemannia gamsii]